MQENYFDYKELSETTDIYYTSLTKIDKIIKKKNFNSHFSSIAIDEILENSKIKEIKMKSSKIFI